MYHPREVVYVRPWTMGDSGYGILGTFRHELAVDSVLGFWCVNGKCITIAYRSECLLELFMFICVLPHLLSVRTAVILPSSYVPRSLSI